MTHEEFIKRQVDQWRELRAWGVSLRDLTVVVSPRAHAMRLGTCWPTEHRLTLYRQDHVEDVLKTALHEMAHAVERYDDHGAKWQMRFASAVEEVTGIPVVCGAGNYRAIDDAARDAVRAWWSRSGLQLAYNLLTGGRA